MKRAISIKKDKIIFMLEKIPTSPVLISVIVLVFCLGVVGGVTIYLHVNTFTKDFWLNILVESYGMLFDIFVIGILIFWLQDRGIKKLEEQRKIREKEFERKRTIQRYEEEIEDYLGWDEKEATFRIVGNIKRLKKLEVGFINL